MDMPDVLKKDVWKVNIVLHVWLELNDHSKCLMSASTALQTNLKNLFSEDIHKHISLYRASFNFLIIDAGMDDSSNPFWRKSMKIPSCNQSYNDQNNYR